jgi:beta-glucosidase
MIRIRAMCWLPAAMAVACAGGAQATGNGAAAASARGGDRGLPPPTRYADWPAIGEPRAGDAALDARARRIVAGMTLTQKVGQMTQAEIKSITPDEVREYYIGSVLNGGGSWPGMNKHAGIGDWLHLADAYYDASMATDMKVKVPIIWGTDAVHGDSNVFGATLFPHNVGLGAAHDPALVRAVGAPFLAAFADIRISAAATVGRHDLSCASVGVR